VWIPIEHVLCAFAELMSYHTVHNLLFDAKITQKTARELYKNAQRKTNGRNTIVLNDTKAQTL